MMLTGMSLNTMLLTFTGTGKGQLWGDQGAADSSAKRGMDNVLI